MTETTAIRHTKSRSLELKLLRNTQDIISRKISDIPNDWEKQKREVLLDVAEGLYFPEAGDRTRDKAYRTIATAAPEKAHFWKVVKDPLTGRRITDTAGNLLIHYF